MHFTLLFMIFVAFATCQVEAVTILNWIWEKPSTKESTVLVADGVPLISIPYESMTDDEKFLQEAAKFTELQVSSPLETCQHKVVMKIRTSCIDMSEEDLAKLSVNLLNCQSSVEGRKIYPCTEEMSLKQCTTEMDADMWNAYHLMSNRARAVCYAARNVQFRALTEITVNKLVQTAHSQIKALDSLQQSQERLEEQTLEALSSLATGNKKLLDQQNHLKDAQTTAYNLVATNLRDLTTEKALIRAGHAQLTSMTEDIRNKLERASEDMLRQESERELNHQEVMEDLLVIQERAQLLWETLESSTNHILKQNQEAVNQYTRTLEQLTQINQTIHYVWNLTNLMHAEVDEKLVWITDYIDSTGLHIQKVYRTVLHVVYIMITMIVAGFLQAPFLTRAAIMGIIPLNLAAYLKHGPDASLDFFSVTALIILITLMHYLMSGIQYLFGSKKTLFKESVRSLNQMNGNVQNGHAVSPAFYVNGSTKNVFVHNSSTISPSSIQKPFYSRMLGILYAALATIFDRVYRVTDASIGKVVNFFHSLASWAKQSFAQQEELSCSYIAKRARENVFSYNAPNISEDIMEHDLLDDSPGDSVLSRDRYLSREDIGWNIRNRQTVSRSTTPSDSSSGNRCCEITRSGKRCRGKMMRNQNYCYIHAQGSAQKEF